jgi:hypothetical protein
MLEAIDMAWRDGDLITARLLLDEVREMTKPCMLTQGTMTQGDSSWSPE